MRQVMPYNPLWKSDRSPQAYIGMVEEQLGRLSPEAMRGGEGKRAKLLALALGAIIGFALLAGAALAYQQHVQREKVRRERIRYVASHIHDERAAQTFVRRYGRFIWPYPCEDITCNQTCLKLAEMHARKPDETWRIFKAVKDSGCNHLIKETVYGQAEPLFGQPRDAWDNYNETVTMPWRDPLSSEIAPLLEINASLSSALAFDRDFGNHTPYYGPALEFYKIVYTRNATMARQLFSWANHSFTKAIEGDPDRDGVSTWEEFHLFETNPLKQEPWRTDFSWVVDILDTPEKVLRYMELMFVYGDITKRVDSAYAVFTHKRGLCGDLSIFRTYVLIKHGYEAYYTVACGTWNDESCCHAFTLFHNETGYYVLDFIDSNITPFVVGPCNNAREAVLTWDERNPYFSAGNYTVYILADDPHHVILRKVEEGRL